MPVTALKPFDKYEGRSSPRRALQDVGHIYYLTLLAFFPYAEVNVGGVRLFCALVFSTGFVCFMHGLF